MYVELKKLSPTNAQGARSIIIRVPVTEEALQIPSPKLETFAPMKTLTELGKKITSGMDGSLGFPIMGAAGEMMNMYKLLKGSTLHNESYYAQAFKDITPADISVKLEFRTGLLNSYDGQTEVYSPLKNLYNSFLPLRSGTGIGLNSPQLSGANVFSLYAKTFFEASKLSSSSLFSKETAAESQGLKPTEVKGEEVKEEFEKTTKISPTEFESKVYRVRYFYRSVAGTEANIIDFRELILKNINISLSTMGDNRGYPLHGSATLSLTAQKIYVLDTSPFVAG